MIYLQVVSHPKADISVRVFADSTWQAFSLPRKSYLWDNPGRVSYPATYPWTGAVFSTALKAAITDMIFLVGPSEHTFRLTAVLDFPA